MMIDSTTKSGGGRSVGPPSRRWLWPILLALFAVLIHSGVLPAQTGDLRIEAKPVPGQLDVLQGTAFQLGGTPPDSGPRPSGYRWEILEGEGGELLSPDRAEAIFRAPVLEDKDRELFVIQLTASYGDREPSRARLHVRVLKELPEKSERQVAEEEEISDDFLPQDFPLAEEVPEIGYLGGSPGDTFDPGFGADLGGFDDPGFGGGFDDPGFGWLVYGNAIGGDKNELLHFYGFDSFAEVDAWPSKREVLVAAIGEEDAARLLAALEAVSQKTTSLWQLEPGLSQSAGD